MDKNHINIDDLFRNRLSGAEEKERSGAWLAMKDLLDAEMPVQPAFNWRRMFGMLTTLLIATSASVGGYKFYAHQQAAGIAANSPAVALSHTNGRMAGVKAAATVDKPGRSGSSSNTSSSEAGTPVAANALVAGPSSGYGASGNAADHQQAVTDNPASAYAGTTHATTAATVANGSHTGGTTTHHIATRHWVSTSRNSALARHAVTASSTDKSAAVNQAKPAAPVLAAAHTKIPAVNSAVQASGSNMPASSAPRILPASGSVIAATSSRRSGADRSKPATDRSMPVLQGSMAAKPNTPVKEPTLVTRKDTIQQIEVVYRRMLNPLTQKVTLKADTIARYTVVVDRLTPLKTDHADDIIGSKAMATGNDARSEAENPLLLPAAKNDAALGSDNNLVSLSKFRVSGKLHNAWTNNAERLSQFAKNVSFAVARSQFYGGITGGFNTTMFSVNTLAGFQLGFTGMLAFNERWSLTGALKYYQRFNNGSSIGDDYILSGNFVQGNVVTTNGKEYREYTWTEDKVSHSFNLTTVQTIELPLTLRRNIGRIFGEAGLNLMYAFAVNAEEIDRPNNTPATVSRLIPSGTTPEVLGGGRPQVRLSDFGSRFGLGYVLGAGYQITPALHADCRVLCQFWDNAASDGARKVSRNLYQTPSLQLSIGYRFSQNKTIRPGVRP